MVNQATVSPASTAAWPRASQKWLLPVPDGPQMHRFSLRCTHSRVRQGVLGRAWDGGCLLVPDVEGLAGGERRAFAAGAQVGGVAAGGFLGEQDPHDLGGVPALRLGGRDEVDQVAGGCRAASAVGSARSPRPAGRRPSRRRCVIAVADRRGSLSGLIAVSAGQCPKRVGPRPRCLAAGCGSRWPLVGRLLLARRPGGRGCGSGRSRRTGRRARPCPGPGRPSARVQLGQGDRFGHLRPDPAGAGGGGLGQPGRGAGAEREERRLLGAWWPAGCVAVRRWPRARRVVLVVDRGLPGVERGWRATSAGPCSPTAVTISSSPWRRAQTRVSTSWWGTE